MNVIELTLEEYIAVMESREVLDESKYDIKAAYAARRRAELASGRHDKKEYNYYNQQAKQRYYWPSTNMGYRTVRDSSADRSSNMNNELIDHISNHRQKIKNNPSWQEYKKKEAIKAKLAKK